jgi:hypothetical protein
MRKLKSIIPLCGLLLVGISTEAQAQTTKVMAYNTGLAWSDSGRFLTQDLTPIGTDFLAVVIDRNPGGQNDQILYILDLKKKILARKIDVADQGFYWVSPSATTSSFVLSYSDGTDLYISLYGFNKKSRTWSTMADTTQKVTTGYATAPSTPILPGYFVNTVRRNDTLWLDVYKY